MGIEIGCKYCFANIISLLSYQISNSSEFRIVIERHILVTYYTFNL